MLCRFHVLTDWLKPISQQEIRLSIHWICWSFIFYFHLNGLDCVTILYIVSCNGRKCCKFKKVWQFCTQSPATEESVTNSSQPISLPYLRDLTCTLKFLQDNSSSYVAVECSHNSFFWVSYRDAWVASVKNASNHTRNSPSSILPSHDISSCNCQRQMVWYQENVHWH